MALQKARASLVSMYGHVQQHAANARARFNLLPKWKKTLVVIAGIGLFVFCVLTVVYRKELLAIQVDLADRFAKLKYSHFYLFCLVFLVSFPPFIGYSALSMFSGMAYGFPYGWPVLALATTVGSSLCFLLFSRVLNKHARDLALRSEQFSRLVAVLKKDSFFLLFLFRLCPLPYSFSNAALSAIPAVSFSHFVGATILSSPKLLIHVFVGSRLALVEKDSDVAWANLGSAILATLASVVISYVVYARMSAIAPSAGDYELAEELTEQDEFEVV